ncbi:type II CRISPR-associated endonuclease Cas1 [Candidatus Endomicrobiellum agilis]|uniref:type II CRISPR-associated endonuclease Cas1 n=1 Tax=Candidatus Endomicrobiellum agilis TaxID=3238957 RepID=UPI003588956D|nr:type II CRISPR-associated endonuclease Cas1 [Endomicrobium sp.]
MWRIIDISGDGYHICVKNNNLSVLKDNEEKLHANFLDINCVILHGNSITYTNSAIQKCIQNKIPIVFCDKTHTPAGMLLPYFNIAEYGKRLEIQLSASQPIQKQAWKQIITEKLTNQAVCLASFSKSDNKYLQLLELAKEVKTGDNTFREGIGAKVYFGELFSNFYRNNKNEDIINSSLNYGYAVLRSSIARAVVACGLNPAIGVFHSKNKNPFCLVDDLIEPLRPMVDYVIKSQYYDFIKEKILTPALKKILVSITEKNLFFENSGYSFIAGLQKYVQSYLAYISKQQGQITFPQPFYDIKI